MFISKKRLEKIEDRIRYLENRIEDREWILGRISTLEDSVGHDQVVASGHFGSLFTMSEDIHPTGLYRRIHLLAKSLGYEYNDVEIIEGFTKIKKGKK